MNSNLAYESILRGPEFFTCRKYCCTLLRSACVKRQEATAYEIANWKQMKFRKVFRYERCVNCEQGKEIRGDSHGTRIN